MLHGTVPFLLQFWRPDEWPTIGGAVEPAHPQPRWSEQNNSLSSVTDGGVMKIKLVFALTVLLTVITFSDSLAISLTPGNYEIKN